MSSPFSKHDSKFIEKLRKLKTVQPSYDLTSVKEQVDAQKRSFNETYAKALISDKETKHRGSKTAEVDVLKDMSDRKFVDSKAGELIRYYERIMGVNDLLPVDYLSKGLIAAHAVCRICVADSLEGTYYGTGFMIAPGLLMTNHHVISKVEEAANAIIEFGVERDQKGFPLPGIQFELKPDLGFITSPESALDFSIIAVSDVSRDGNSKLSDFGFLRLIPDTSKVKVGNFVSLIEHPDGGVKYVAIRENKIVQIGSGNDDAMDNYLWYQSDTAPGSSGSPVFNDCWQVVAIHHSGVPESRRENGETQYQSVTGRWVSASEAKQLPDDQIKWIANEGVRISRIMSEAKKLMRKTENKKFTLINDFIEDAFSDHPCAEALKYEAMLPSVSSQVEAILNESIYEGRKRQQKNLRPLSYYNNRKGYDPKFLETEIALPEFTAKALSFGAVAGVTGSAENELKYTHFSIKFNKDRKMAFFTAVNIDGKKWVNIKRGSDEWYFDPRLPLDVQVGNDLYSNEPSNGGKGWFDRGHLVRRQDPDWDTRDIAKMADEDTFHWTNCTPQYWEFNQDQELWQGLENYILYNTEQERIRATVFTGPVFEEDDEEHRGVLIPKEFWKVIVVMDKKGKLYSSAFIVSQEKYATDISFEKLPVGDFNNFQVSIAHIEKKTGLKFADAVEEADVAKEFGMEKKGLRTLADITHPRR
ncbi:MAG: DNA/RNA non-specific endonuclease [Bacteroidota bacterium]|nr:DNA/RNA non-specific endonuclease [Bacteroidota bacterium]